MEALNILAGEMGEVCSPVEVVTAMTAAEKKKKKRKLIMYSPLGFCDREEFLDGFVRLFVLRRDAGE